MPFNLLERAFRFSTKSQLWIALCAWATSASSFCVIEAQLLPWQWGLLIALIVLSSYSWYYASNPSYPYARVIALVSSLLSIGGYLYVDCPKPMLVICLIVLSAMYMLPLGKKNKLKLLFRLLILSLVWSLFTFYFPLQHHPNTLNAALFFVYRFLFFANLCYIFLIKDDAQYFSASNMVFIKQLLVAAQGIAIIAILLLFSGALAIAISIPYLLTILFYKKQTPHSGVYFYSLGIDGLLILESIFVQSLFIYGLGRFSTF
jgi:hypothetical protein